MSGAPSVLFVCLGNICRSPMAEGALRVAARDAGLDVAIDSAGTGGWHVGNPPDSRAVATAREKGVDISRLRARQVTADDFTRFTHIFALDAQNLADLQRLAPADGTAEVALLLDIVPGREGDAVADPYYGDADGFEIAWSDVSSAAAVLVARLKP
ncbi:low molecular weight protein-tyrosine-phosphatase [Aurantiacibacter sediminis]|uniref:protein-tyrosine-phosphatase n=1 Tax=Aurantiacibacter sediminis TaxID=2793064 RepID=A0ABS0N1J5_9SPHN|nr:low molecular weight protein-tyrosine-phosphatase [Aurantiacibacter sediminis]MBH5321829.1 low molecular weight phosphotyrosine protein phosphatase [Aurantiacibacter sediminis]